MRITKSVSVLLPALLLGIAVTTWNIYQLSLLQREHINLHHRQIGPRGVEHNASQCKTNSGDVHDRPVSNSSGGDRSAPTSRNERPVFNGSGDRPVFWIDGHNLESGYLDHVIELFERVGYVRGDEDSAWDVLWTHSHPFKSRKLESVFEEMGPHQKVNHFPGIHHITNKVSLVTSGIKYIPIAFSLPEKRKEFLKEAKKNPGKLWVQKGTNHGNIQVKPVEEIDLHERHTFIQEYIDNPLLIDGKRFDIGVYAILTSVDPLRVYILHDEFVVRFCLLEYEPIDFENQDKYVVKHDHTSLWEMPSLKKYYNHSSQSFKETLNSYLRSLGKNPDVIHRQVYDAIAGAFISKNKDLIKDLHKMKHKRSYFELVRCDFILDEDLNLYFLEVGVSPGLSTRRYEGDRYVYEQVIYNTLSVAGIARNVPSSLNKQPSNVRDFQVSDREIAVPMEKCFTKDCEDCHEWKCELCVQCMSDGTKEMLKGAYLEHYNRMSTRRVYPEAMTQEEARQYDDDRDSSLVKNDRLMRLWFREKCLTDLTWCQ